MQQKSTNKREKIENMAEKNIFGANKQKMFGWPDEVFVDKISQFIS